MDKYKTCAGCETEKPHHDFHRNVSKKDGLQIYCKACVKERYSAPEARLMRQERQKTNPKKESRIRTPGARAAEAKRYKANNAEKVKARKLFYYATKCGKIKKQPCIICGASLAQGHHDNYARPLDVVWLCRAHHIERHRGLNRDTWVAEEHIKSMQSRAA